MRRRAADFRRPVRRNLSCWISSLLGLFCVAGFILFTIQHFHAIEHKDPIRQPTLDKINRNVEVIHERLNFTEDIKSANSYARQLSEQMTLAKAYVIIAKEHNNLHLAWELTSKIRSCQFLLSKAAMRENAITLDEAKPIIKSLSSLIFKAQDAHYDIATTIMTMKSHIQALEERTNAATVQSTVFGKIAAEAMPKNLHCLNIMLMADWLNKKSLQDLANEKENSLRLVDNSLYHFAIFSDNLLAVSVVVNSTVSNADHPKQLVFHIVTNRVAYGPMQAWFLSNDFKGSAVEVLMIEDLTWLNHTHSPVVKQLTEEDVWAYYFKGHLDDIIEPKIRNPKYISLLNHLRFYVPQIYPQLEKVVFLDDDVVVQKDLTPLFSLDLHGNVNGAVETCLEAFHRYYKYLNFSNPLISSKIDPQACGWAFGMNVFDLITWRKADVTARYHYWQEQNSDKSLWKLGTLPVGLLAFYGLTEPLDRRWHVLGLGYDLNIDNRLIESAAVIHFNGNMKPWQKFGISRYRPLWESSFHALSTQFSAKKKIIIDPFEPATTVVKEIMGTIDGIKLRVLDTPGLGTSLKDQSLNKNILKSIRRFMNNCPPDVVIYVDRLDMQSQDLSDLPLLGSITSSLGSSLWYKTCVTLTHAASTPPNGPSGEPLSYEKFVALRSHVIQQLISHATGEQNMIDADAVNPVCLVENQGLLKKNRDEQVLLPNGEAWKPQLLLLCYSVKILSKLKSAIKAYKIMGVNTQFDFLVRSPPHPHLLSSLLQSCGHLKFSADQHEEEATFGKGSVLVGRNTKLVTCAGLNMKSEVSVKISSSEQLHIPVVILLSIVHSIFSKILS